MHPGDMSPESFSGLQKDVTGSWVSHLHNCALRYLPADLGGRLVFCGVFSFGLCVQ